MYKRNIVICSTAVLSKPCRIHFQFLKNSGTLALKNAHKQILVIHHFKVNLSKTL